MNTYVSQLMQQTGIALPSATARRGGSDLADTFSMAEMPIREEHQEVVVPQPIQSVAPLLQHLPASPAIDRTMPAAPVENRAIGDENVSDPLSAAPRTAPLETSELTVVERVELKTARENVSVPHQQQPRRNLAQPTTEETTTAPLPLEVAAIHQSESVSQPADDVVMTPQSYLQVVRDWVAGTPTVVEEVREITPNQLNREDPTQPMGAKNYWTSPLGLEQIDRGESSSANLQQDFVLSIGSIHVTISSPSLEISPPPPIVPQQAVSAPDTDSFRLSRHYLRFR
jgi:hypothetical protein